MKMHSTKCVIPYPYKVSKRFFLTHFGPSPPHTHLCISALENSTCGQQSSLIFSMCAYPEIKYAPASISIHR